MKRSVQNLKQLCQLLSSGDLWKYFGGLEMNKPENLKTEE